MPAATLPAQQLLLAGLLLLLLASSAHAAGGHQHIKTRSLQQQASTSSICPAGVQQVYCLISPCTRWPCPVGSVGIDYPCGSCYCKCSRGAAAAAGWRAAPCGGCACSRQRAEVAPALMRAAPGARKGRRGGTAEAKQCLMGCAHLPCGGAAAGFLRRRRARGWLLRAVRVACSALPAQLAMLRCSQQHEPAHSRVQRRWHACPAHRCCCTLPPCHALPSFLCCPAGPRLHRPTLTHRRQRHIWQLH